MTKHDQVLHHLKEHGSITSWEAIMEYGATRLSGIIYKLKERGLNVQTELVRNASGKSHHAKYTVDKEDMEIWWRANMTKEMEIEKGVER